MNTIHWSWYNLDEKLRETNDAEVYIINDCPSVYEALSKLDDIVRFILKQRLVLLCIKTGNSEVYNIGETTFNSQEFQQKLQNIEGSFLIAFESIHDSSGVINWKLKDKQQIFKLEVEANSCCIGDFVCKFLMKCLKDNHDGLNLETYLEEDGRIIQISIEMLCNTKGLSLFFQAAKDGNSDVVKYLIDFFEINQDKKGKLAIDYAYEAKKYDTTFILLTNNSKYPKHFKENLRFFPFALREFIITSKSMHDAIESNDEQEVLYILLKNPGLNYFFNFENQSALTVALEKRAFNIFKILIDKKITLGPHERFEEIMDVENFNSTEKECILPISILREKGLDNTFKKNECNWESLHSDLSKASHKEILIVVNCPSMKSAVSELEYIKINFFTKVRSSIALYLKIIESKTFLSKHHLYDMIGPLTYVKKPFLIWFESSIDHSSQIYWKAKEKREIMKLSFESNDSVVGEFVSEFIVKALKDGCNGLHSAMIITQRVFIDVSLEWIANGVNFNLLFHAAQIGNDIAVEFLVSYFDVNHEINDKLAIDLAYEAENYKTVHILLEENSRFPREFDESNFSYFPFELKEFIITSKSMHDSIISRDDGAVSFILQQNQHLKYFFNTKNESALAVALEKRAFGIYKILIDKKKSLGPHESFKEIMEGYTAEERNKLSDINLKESYILKLLDNSIVGPDDELKDTRCAHVLKAFESLNKIEEVKPLLKFTAAQENFQLIFDFNRDHVQFLDPNSEYYITGLFYLSGRIYIGAKYLLDEERAHEVYGVIAHEICHFVMFKVFDNFSKPYAFEDMITAENFQKITEYCETLSVFDSIIALVYEEYEEHQQHAELIVRIPHLLGHYHDNPKKMREVKENLSELYRFYIEHCVPIIVSKLEGHDKKETIMNNEITVEPNNLALKEKLFKLTKIFKRKK